MGGRGSGGRRVGAGAKPKTARQHALDGTVSRGVVLQHPSSAPPDVVERFDAPALLPLEAQAVWAELAPGAFEARTLIKSTAARFRQLCMAVVEERALAAKRDTGPDRGRMMAAVAIGMKDFGIAPLGKPMSAAEPAAAANPLDRFTKARA